MASIPNPRKKMEDRRSKMEGPSRRGEVMRKCRRLVPRLVAWYAGHARDLPWRRTRDPYAVWIAEIMLQQTQVKTVIRYWERWMRELPDVRALARATPERVLKLWEGLGYYSRARNLRTAAQLIVTQHGGRFPESFNDILALPGVGRYTAGAICSISFNQPAPILDGNVVRVLTRAFGLRQNPREKDTNTTLWRLAELLVPYAKYVRHMPASSFLLPPFGNCSALRRVRSRARKALPRPPTTRVGGECQPLGVSEHRSFRTGLGLHASGPAPIGSAHRSNGTALHHSTFDHALSDFSRSQTGPARAAVSGRMPRWPLALVARVGEAGVSQRPSPHCGRPDRACGGSKCAGSRPAGQQVGRGESGQVSSK